MEVETFIGKLRKRLIDLSDSQRFMYGNSWWAEDDREAFLKDFELELSKSSSNINKQNKGNGGEK